MKTPGGRLTKFEEKQNMFRCPVCKGKLSVTGGGSFMCRKKHCFDVSAKGYVNFLGGQGLHKNKYDKELFECRNQIFCAGFYDPVLEEILECVRGYAPGALKKRGSMEGAGAESAESAPIAVLDVGCGEGFYANWLSRRCEEADIYGIDLIKEAIQIACREKNDVKWIVGNLADIPLFNGVFDVLLNVLTPANYKEFERILKRDGVLIKVVPGCDYLREIRDCVSDQLVNKAYSNDSTVEYFKENMEFVERRCVHYAMPVTAEQAGLFLRMTPMTFHVDTAEIPEERMAQIREITIHLELLIGKKKQIKVNGNKR